MIDKRQIAVIDVETDGLYTHEGHTPFLLGIEFEDGEVWKFDLRRDMLGLCCDILGRNDERLQTVREIVEDPNAIKAAHNAKFEIRMLRTLGWEPRGDWWCTMNMCVLNDEYSRLGLDYLAKRHFDRDYEEADLIEVWLARQNRMRRDAMAKAGRPRDEASEPTYEEFYEVMPEIMSAYLEEDLDNCMRLALMWRRPCTTQYGNGNVFKVETALVPVVANMEDTGINMDLDFCFQAGQRYEEMAAIEEIQMYDVAGCVFNANSPQQLMRVFKQLGYKIANTRKDTLQTLEGDFPRHLLEYRADFKVGGWFRTFLRECTDEGVIHPQFWQNGQDEGIKTGRFSITRPGFQTLPGGYRGTVGTRGKDVRKAVIPRLDHNLFMLDYAQVEPRILAHYTQDPRMLAALASGIDIYRAFIGIFFTDECAEAFKRLDRLGGSMDRLFKDNKDLWALLTQRRSDAKTIILALTYGMGIPKMAANLKVAHEVARKMKAQCYKEMPLMSNLMTECSQEVARYGFIDDEVGRRYRVPRELSYKGINAIIQGLAAQVMKRALIDCDELIIIWNEMHRQENQYVRARQILTVHDEILFEIPEGQEDELVPLLQLSMEQVMPELTVPLVSDVNWGAFGRSWGEKSDWFVGAASTLNPDAFETTKSPDGTIKPVVGQISTGPSSALVESNMAALRSGRRKEREQQGTAA